jgi:Cu2+-exporting ATPase
MMRGLLCRCPMSMSEIESHDNASRAPFADSPDPHGLSATLTPAQAAGLDDPAVLAQCQVGPTDAEGAVPIGLGISGMYCAACAITIESALAGVPGVKQALVQGASQRARITLDPKRVHLSDLVRAVQKAGYRAWPDAGARAISERRRTQRTLLWRFMVAGFCMMQVMMITTGQYVTDPGEIPADIWRLMNWASWVLSLPVVLFSCGPFFKGAWTALRHGRIAMDTPVALGIGAMFIVSSGVTFGRSSWLGHETYFDSLTMFVTFLLGGRWLEARSREKVTQSLEWLSGRLPEAVERAARQVSIEDLAGVATETVPVSSLRPGDLVRVPVGQAFPADGPIVLGRTEVDEALLTGESQAVARQPGQSVVAGSMNLGSPVWCRIEHLGPDTRYQQIVSLVHQALTEKPGWLGAADRFAGPFLWAVLAVAALGGAAWWWIDPSKSLWVAVSVLVVTCPCALSLAAPAALLSAAGALAKSGVLVRHLNALEALSTVQTLLFDKTGTLTEPQLNIDEVWSDGRHWHLADALSQGALGQQVHALAALAAQSQHPLSKAIAALGRAEDVVTVAAGPVWTEVREQAGAGLEARDAGGRWWRLGSAQWALGAAGLSGLAEGWGAGRVWWAPQSGDEAKMASEALGFSLSEKLRASATPALKSLRAQGIELALLSGDRHDRVVALLQQIDLDPPLDIAQSGATPEGKVQTVAAMQQAGGHVGVVGDGINDAPVLARAGVSFALDQGAPLAQSQADFIVLGGHLSGVPQAVAISRRAMQVVRQNLVWAAAYNFVCIPVALSGHLPPWLAGLGMAASSLAVMLNALRLQQPR